MKTASEYADEIMVMIREDIAAGKVSPIVWSFDALHNYVDANGYTLAAHVPWGGDAATAEDPEGMALVNAVENEITRRLQTGAHMEEVEQ